MQKFALLLAGVALAGCQTVSSTWNGITSPDTPSSTPAPSPPAAPPPAQSAMVKPSTAPITSLNGQSGEALQALWGEPSLKRKDLGSELWQYAGKGCTVLIFLYPSSGGALTVTHVEAVPGGQSDEAVAACAKAAGKPPLKPMS